MHTRNKWLLYYAEQLNLSPTTKPANDNLPIDQYWEKEQLLTPVQIDQLRFLFLKNCLLYSALRANYLNEQQKTSLLNYQISHFAHGQTKLTLQSLKKNWVPIAFYRQTIAQLKKQQIISDREYCLFEKIATTAQNTDITVAGNNAHSNFDSKVTVDQSPAHTDLMPASFARQVIETQGVPVSTTTIAVGRMFHHYRIDKELGRGGMGIVYKAYDSKLDRVVALKLIRAGEDVSEVQIERFLREARSIAKLNHANIIRVYEVGESHPKYFTMEYVDGEDLATRIKESKLEFATTAQIVKKIAEALHFSHRQGIIHRDIKPSNIMLDQNQEPRLMDFGLVKVADDNKLSLSGDVLGTPAYMSPEQVNGREADARSDMYSLGATLYEALVGRPPFQGQSAMNVFCQIMDKEPIRPGELNPDVPRDMEAITLKCLEKKPHRRYLNAKMLARDLDNFLHQRPTTAVPPTQFNYFQKWVLRNKAIAVISGLLVLSVAIFVPLLYMWMYEARDKERQASFNAQEALANAKRAAANAKKAEAEEMKAKLALYYSNILAAAKLKDEGNTKRARATLQECAPRYRHWEWFYLWKSLRDDIASFGRKYSRYICCDVSPDGTFVLTGVGACVELWDIEQRMRLWKHDLSSITDKNVASCKFSPDGNTIAITAKSEQNNIILVDANDGRLLQIFQGGKESVTCCDFSPDGTMLATGSDFALGIKTLNIWNVTNGTRYTSVEPPINRAIGDQAKKFIIHTNKEAHVNCCAFSADGKMLVFGHGKNLSAYDVRNQRITDIVRNAHERGVNSCTFHPHTRFIVTGGEGGLVKLWYVSTAGKIRFIYDFLRHERLLFTTDNLYQRQQLNKKKITPLLQRLFADAGMLLSPGAIVKIRTQNLEWEIKDVARRYLIVSDAENSGELIAYWGQTTHKLAVGACHFSPRGDILVTAAEDQVLKLWKLDIANSKFLGGQFLHTLSGHEGTIRDCRFYNDENIISIGRSIKLWSTSPQKYTRKLRLEKNCDIKNCAFSPDGKTVALAGKYVLKLWDWQNNNVRDLVGERFSFCAFHPQGDLLLAANEKFPFMLKLWNTQQRTIVREWRAHRSEVTCCAFSPDGETAISCGKTRVRGKTLYAVKLWQVASAKLLRVFVSKYKKKIRFCRFSPDGSKIIATGGSFIQMWDVATGARFLDFDDRIGKNIYKIVHCTFAADGKRLVTADDQNISRFVKGNKGERVFGLLLWDLPGKNLLQSFEAHDEDQSVLCCDVSADGRRLISAGSDFKMRIWDMRIAENRSGREIWHLPEEKHFCAINFCEFSADSQSIVAATGNMAMLWHINNWFLFRCSTVHANELNQEKFPKDLRSEFRATGDTLTKHAIVQTITPDKKWQILDAIFIIDNRDWSGSIHSQENQAHLRREFTAHGYPLEQYPLHIKETNKQWLLQDNHVNYILRNCKNGIIVYRENDENKYYITKDGDRLGVMYARHKATF